MKIASRFRWFQVVAALVAVTWTGCAATTGTKPVDLASNRDQTELESATRSQFANLQLADAPSAGGYQAQFASVPTPRPQQRYAAASCSSGFG
ncbi:MAG TPA: hypothetical protein VMM76_01460 [Pirellulaceae bacterium]|nr:hypothetical protein [Pirellulaceae bacterium]